MFMSAPPRVGFHGSDIFAFEKNMTARAQRHINNRRFRKLIARDGKHPLIAGRPTHHRGIMTSEDWAFAGVPDGIQDSFEAQQLRNRYLAGTAGSPYSDSENCLLFQRIQQFDGSFSNKRPVMDPNQPWQQQHYGVPATNDIQSMFAPMHFHFGVSSMDDVPMSASGSMGQNMAISSPVFSASESGASFGSFSSNSGTNLLDSGSFSSADGSSVITSPSHPFEYVNSPFNSSSLVTEDLSNIKAAPPSPPPFSEPTPISFFPPTQDHLGGARSHMNDRHAMVVPVLKSEPVTHHVLRPKSRKGLPEGPRSRVDPNTVSTVVSRRSTPPRRMLSSDPKPESRPSKQPKSCPTAQASTALSDFAERAERSAKDEYLLKAKAEGLTYREIRAKGGFSEAESTLRGRYRTLTKSKEERVRKPEWTDTDIYLLRKAVRKYSKGNDPASSKIPWKQVAEYIQRNGGTYLFGNATCRKKWDGLVVCSSGRHAGAVQR
ncbi:hypothetical protein CSOJ01_07623 [Colletotrichum sojae]|uniref:Myb-like domain-containing protein n=1 Tax=Colletotrichum sojae TaxID=2175907 RepID=A0A8H6J859_9PEZI|nr:hypothetical protein CSOJ01_07623 [Colletotrichum sojae]